jgi:hypothetical protein
MHCTTAGIAIATAVAIIERTGRTIIILMCVGYGRKSMPYKLHIDTGPAALTAATGKTAKYQ